MLYKEYLTKRKPYQADALILLLSRKHACLFDKPGKGKTFPCIEALQEVANQRKRLNLPTKTLILSTADAIRNMWNAEIVPQGILPAGTTLMTFNAAVVEERSQLLLKQKWNVIIIDECHKLKAHNTKISKLCHKLTKNTEYVWGLTGTPRGNSDLDIFCQFHNMNIDEWGSISYSAFCERCCDFENQYFGGRVIKKPLGINEKYRSGFEKNVALNAQIETYGDEDNMPPLKIQEIKLPFEPDQNYKNAKQGLIELDDYATTFTKVVAITKMHQAANGYLYITNDDARIINEFRKNEKIDWLKQNIKTNEKVVIVYRFNADLLSLKKAFENATEDIATFKTKSNNILLLQCGRCESFNLQSVCNRIIFYTLDYSYIKFDQMLHRVWRMGQTLEVIIDVLIFKSSIEEQIWSTVHNKQTAADLFMSIKHN